VPECEFVEVDVASLELTRPRSVGVEQVGLHALAQLEFEPLLASLGINAIARAIILAQVVARMAAPGSELATWRWLNDTSALGELLDLSFTLETSVDRSLPLVRPHWCWRLRLRRRSPIGWRRYAPECAVFGLPGGVAPDETPKRRTKPPKDGGQVPAYPCGASPAASSRLARQPENRTLGRVQLRFLGSPISR